MSKNLQRNAVSRAVATVGTRQVPPAPAPSPEPASEVASQLMFLSNTIEGLETSVNALGQRLAPTLYDESKNEDGTAGAAEPTPNSPLGRQLMDLRFRVARLTAFVDNRLHRDLAL